MSTYKIVVARYNENIEWLGSELKNCIIYNKGTPLNIPNETLLKNVGRESETYLQYIINNYDNLPDIVVFTQANISDHRQKNDIGYLLNLKNEALSNGKSRPFTIYYNGTMREICWEPNWNLLCRDGTGQYYLHNNYLDNNRIVFEDWFKKFIQESYPNPINIYANGLFAVKKDLILNHSVEYYKNLLVHLDHHINPAEGHFFERSWYYIFN